jgi:hypothetical protein
MLKNCFYGVLIVVGCLFVDAPGPIIGASTIARSEVVVAGVFQRGDGKMEEFLRSEEIKEINMRVGDRILLESLRQAVVPPYLMIMPFNVLPDFIRCAESRPLEEDGVHGTIFVLDALASGQGSLTIGFKDLQSGEVTHQKVLTIIVND